MGCVRRGPAALLATLVLSVPTASAAGSTTAIGTRAAQPGRVLVDAYDKPGDALITTARGLSERERRSIDLRRLVVSEHGRFVRLAMTIDHVDRSARLTQVFLVDFAAPGYAFTQLEVATHSQTEPPQSSDGLEHDITTEGAGTPQGFISCHELPIRLRDGERTWLIDIPHRCLPMGRVRIHVYNQTVDGPDVEFEKQYSNDGHTVARRVDLHGKIKRGRS